MTWTLISASSLPIQIEAAYGRPSAPATVEALLRFFSSSIFLCLIIALIVLAIVQLMRPLLRTIGQASTLQNWESEREEYFARFGENPLSLDAPYWVDRAIFPEEPREQLAPRRLEYDNASAFPKASFSSIFSVSNGLFMKQLQDAATLVLARPSLHIGDYLTLTTNANEEDRNTILHLDFVSRTRPDRLADLLEADSRAGKGFAEGVAAAQQSVAAAIERRLDGLQLSLDGQLAFWSRLLSVAIGVTIAWAGTYALRSPQFEVPLLLGALGGLLASLIQETASAALAKLHR